MKHIKAIIKPEKLDDVKEAVKKTGCTGMMVTGIEGHGQQGGIKQQWRGEKYELDLLPKVSIDIVVPDAKVDSIIEAILTSARTGCGMGDGKIFIYDVERVIRIRTGEEDDSAL